MANLTFPSNPTNGQKVTVNDKVFVYNSTTSRWTATRLQVLGNLTDDFTIAHPELSLSNNTVEFSQTGTTVYITYTVDQDVKASIATNGIANSSYANVTLHQTNNTIQITAGTEAFSSANVVLTVTNTRTSNTASIDLSAAYRFTFADPDNVSIQFDAKSQYGVYRIGMWPSAGGYQSVRFGRGIDLSDYTGFENETLWWLGDNDTSSGAVMIEIVSTDINADYMPTDGGDIPNERRFDVPMGSTYFANSNRVHAKGVYCLKVFDTGNGKPTIFASTSDGQILLFRIDKHELGHFTFTYEGNISGLFTSTTSGQMVFGFDIFEESGTTYLCAQTFEGTSGGYHQYSATIWSLSSNYLTATEVGKTTPSTGTNNSFHSTGVTDLFYDPNSKYAIGAQTGKLGVVVRLDLRVKDTPFLNTTIPGDQKWYSWISPLGKQPDGQYNLYALGNVTNDSARILVINSLGNLQMNIYYNQSDDLKIMHFGAVDDFWYIPKGGDGEYPIFHYDFKSAGTGNVNLVDYTTNDDITRILTDAGNGYSSSNFLGTCFTKSNQRMIHGRLFTASNYHKIGYQILE